MKIKSFFTARFKKKRRKKKKDIIERAPFINGGLKERYTKEDSRQDSSGLDDERQLPMHATDAFLIFGQMGLSHEMTLCFYSCVFFVHYLTFIFFFFYLKKKKNPISSS
jgi:hypothetical protein